MMEGLVVSAATGALKPIIAKLAELLGGEYKLFKGVRGKVEFLTKELKAMDAFLLNMSEKENPNEQDKDWMKEVREMSYDIEDSLDEFMLRDDDKSAKPDGFMNKINGLLEKTKTRRHIAKAFQKFKAQVKELAERQARYRQTDSNANNATVDQRAFAIFKDASELVGIDGSKHDVIKLLKQEADGHIPPQQPKVVSIVGLGGLGKTTIAKQVYEELKGQYDCRAFISVSRTPDMEKIFRTILSEVNHQPYYKTEAGGVEKLIEEIKTILEKKRYFIVIDDVWDVKTWETIEWAFSKNSRGSRIMTTTRIHDVAKSCCYLYGGSVYKLRPLKGEDSRRLFCNRIFGPGKEWPSNLDTVSNKILQKCGGLPLAIISISGLLANKAWNGVHSIKEWEQVETSIGHGLERDAGVKGMMEILSLSYFDLPYDLKACLLYLSIFPEDYQIDKNRLVRKWVAEGFVRAEPTHTLYESGEKCFNELINRNLILPGYIDYTTGRVGSCLVHDTILDFIMSKARDDNFVTVHGIPRLTPPPGNKVRRLTLQGKTEGDATLLSNQNYSNVRSLTTFGSFIGPPYSLLDFRLLRVLDLEACSVLQNHHLTNIGELFRLKYLCLRETYITELPEQIGELQYLETLNLYDCRIAKLPTTIVRLKRLVNLLINESPEQKASEWGKPGALRNMPGGIRSMQALEELNTIYVDWRASAGFLEEIGELTKIRNLGILLLYYPEVDTAIYLEYIEKIFSAVQQLNKLQSLSIEFCALIARYGEQEEDPVHYVSDIMLEQPLYSEPWCPASLRKLVLRFPISGVPSWMKLLENLEELDLSVQRFEQEMLDILGGLPVLVRLDLAIITEEWKYIHSTVERLQFSRRCGFPSLRYLAFGYRLYYKTNVVGAPMLMFEAGSMPTLHVLKIILDADTAISLTNPLPDFGLKHLSQLTRFICEITGSKSNVLLADAVIRKELRQINPEVQADIELYAADENSYLTTDKYDDHGRWFATALPLPTDLSFVIPSENVHHHASRRTRKPASSCVHRYRVRRRSTPCQGQSQPPSHKSSELQEVGHEAPNQTIGTSGTHTPAAGFLGPRVVAAPQHLTLPAGFTFGARSSSAAPQPLAGHGPSQPGVPTAPAPARDSWDQNALSSVFKNLSVQKPTSNIHMTSDAGSSNQGRCHGEK